MRQRMWIVSLVLAGVLLLPMLGACTSAGTTVTETVKDTTTVTAAATTVTVTASATATPGGGPEFEVVRAAADAYASSGRTAEITAEELYSLISDMNESNDPFIVNVYEPNTELPSAYALGHIYGAFKVSWGELFKEEGILELMAGYARTGELVYLPKDRLIVVYSYNGHVGAQAAALLNIMGYNAKNLKWGMASWTLDEDIAPGRYDRSVDITPQRIDQIVPETSDHALPVLENTASGDEHEIIKAAAVAYAGSGKPLNISSAELYEIERIRDAVLKPFVLDVNDAALYAKGHLAGAVNIPYGALFKEDNLKKLPTDMQIVVYSYDGRTGSQATALLNALGYNAINLKWGTASLTYSTEVVPDIYNESRDCKDYRKDPPLKDGYLPKGEAHDY